MTNFDFSILYWIRDHIVCEALTPIMKAITTAGNGGMIWIALCVILICFKKTRRIGIAAAISLALVGLLNNDIIKPIVERPRPFQQQELELLIAAPGGFSFPSGHTSSSFAVATAVFLKDKKIGIPALILAALMGFSRLYFFVHFPSDVFVGMLEGIFVAIAVTFVIDKLRKRFTEKKAAK